MTNVELPTPNYATPQLPSVRRGWGHTLCNYMANQDWRPTRKPYDLRERLFEYACLIVRIVQFLHTRGPIAVALSYQLLKCGTSAGANYEEADDGSSDRDALAKKKIVLRELKEARFRLRILQRCGLLTGTHDPVVNETDELVRILAKIVRSSKT